MSTTTIEIDGIGRVELDRSFLEKTPAEQDAIVAEIAASARPQRGARPPASRTVTVTFDDGSSHIYRDAPADLTPEQVTARAEREFGKRVTHLNGGRSPQAASPDLARIKRNVSRMIDQSAPETDIDAYLAEEGVTAAQLRAAKNRPSSPPPVPAAAPAPEAPDPAGMADGYPSDLDPMTDEWFAEQERQYQASIGNPPPEDRESGMGIGDLVAGRRPEQSNDLQSMLIGAGDAVTFGFLDEAGAVADMLTGMGKGSENIWTSDKPLSEIYSHNRDLNRAKLRMVEGEDPGMFLAGNIAGGLAPVGGGIASAAKARGALAKLKAGAKAGAAYGAAYGFGSDEGNPLERLDGAAWGAAGGAIGGAALGTAAHAGEAALSPLAQKLFPKLAEAKFAREQAGNPHRLTDAKVADDLDKLVQTMMVDGARRKLSKGQRATLLSRVDDLEASYLPRAEVKSLDLPPSVKARLDTAMAKRQLLSDAEVQSLRDGTPAGDAVADGIEKARRLRAYVSEASGTRNAGSFLAEAVGSAAGFKVAGPIGSAVGGRIGRAAVRSEDRAAKEALALADKAPQFAKLPEVQAAREAAGDGLTRLSADAMDASYNASKAAEAEAARLETEGRKVAVRNARDNIRPSGGWRGLIYDRVGLLPREQDAAALSALNDGAISPEQFQAYLDEPGKLMSGNAGNALIDRMAAYADSGRLKRDPKWTPRPVLPREAELLRELDELDPVRVTLADGTSSRDSELGLLQERPDDLARVTAIRGELDKLRSQPAGVRNPLAYTATANANQARVTDTLSAVRGQADLAHADRETIATAVAAIGNTSSREDAQRIATDALGRLGADRQSYARSVLSPLIEQIRR